MAVDYFLLGTNFFKGGGNVMCQVKNNAFNTTKDFFYPVEIGGTIGGTKLHEDGAQIPSIPISGS